MFFPIVSSTGTSIASTYPQEFSGKLDSSTTEKEYSITFPRAIFILTKFGEDVKLDIQAGSKQVSISGGSDNAGYYFHTLTTPYNLHFNGSGSFKFSIAQVDPACSSLQVNSESHSWKIKNYVTNAVCCFDANPYGSYEAKVKDYPLKATQGTLYYTGYQKNPLYIDPYTHKTISGVYHPIFMKFKPTVQSKEFKVKPDYSEKTAQYDVETEISLNTDQMINGKNGDIKLTVWQIALIVVAIVVVVVICVVVYIIKKRKDKKKKQIDANSDETKTSSAPPMGNQVTSPQMSCQYPTQQQQQYPQQYPQVYPQQPVVGSAQQTYYQP